MEEKETTERTEFRTANRKVYEHADHTMTAEIFLEPVHYQDSDGSWKDMEDTLSEDTAEEFTEKGSAGEAAEKETTASSDSRDLSNEKGDWKVTFRNKTKEEKTVSLKKGSCQISWSPEGAAKVRSEKNSPSEVIYPGIFEGVDLHCRVQGEKIKEDLVVQEKEYAPQQIAYRYQFKKLTPEKRGSRVVFLGEEAQEIFTVTAPLMVDAGGKTSKDIQVDLELLEKDSCRITFTPDAAWMQAEERAYPVIIDPVITTSLGVTEIYDAYVSLSSPNTNTLTQSYLYLNGGTDIRRSFLKFTLPEIKSSDMIVRATLALVSSNTDGVQRTITAHRVLQDWESSSITWNNKPLFHEEAEDLCTYTADEAKYVTFDLTRMVKEWYLDDCNYGVMLKRENELSGSTVLLSSDYPYTADTTLRPRIQIQYRSFSGLENFWTYHTQNVGRAGTVHVNDYCGNLILKHEAVSTGGSRMPAQLSLVYNSTYYTSAWGYGKGFCLNYYQTIASETIGDTQYYRYQDGDGTIHYFYHDSDKNKWMDESGLDLTLVKTTGTDGSVLIDITDKEGNQLHFRAGYLEKILDRNGNTLLIEHDAEQKNRITKITDGAGREITLTYNQNTDGTMGNLKRITDPAGMM